MTKKNSVSTLRILVKPEYNFYNLPIPPKGLEVLINDLKNYDPENNQQINITITRPTKQRQRATYSEKLELIKYIKEMTGITVPASPSLSYSVLEYIANYLKI